MESLKVVKPHFHVIFPAAGTDFIANQTIEIRTFVMIMSSPLRISLFQLDL
jgi:hypothetical protein